jgi:hypothetical protein
MLLFNMNPEKAQARMAAFVTPALRVADWGSL